MTVSCKCAEGGKDEVRQLMSHGLKSCFVYTNTLSHCDFWHCHTNDSRLLLLQHLLGRHEHYLHLITRPGS